MAKSNKISNSSTKKKKQAKNHSAQVFGEALGMRAWKDGQLTDTIRDIITQKMQEFLTGPDEWNSIPQFVTQLGVHYSTYMKWAAEDKRLNPVHKFFVQALGAKRQPHAEWKKYGATDAIKLTLYQYHPDYQRVHDDDKAYAEYMVKLKAKENESSIAKLVEYFKDKEVELPEFDDSKVRNEEDNVSTGDSG